MKLLRVLLQAFHVRPELRDLRFELPAVLLMTFDVVRPLAKLLVLALELLHLLLERSMFVVEVVVIDHVLVYNRPRDTYDG
jgi:hypothetical protein